jgi:hypothetical protein
MQVQPERRGWRHLLGQAIGVVGLLAMCGAFGVGCEGCDCRCDGGHAEPGACDPSPMSCFSCGGYEQCDAGVSFDTGVVPPIDTGRDAYVRVDAPSCAGARPLGDSCLSGVCERGLMCLPPLSAVLRDGAEVAIGEAMCSVGCDPETDACGACGGCSVEVPFGSGRVHSEPVCRRTCTPTLRTRGDCADGFACDPRTALCVPACRDDEDCHYAPQPDGTFTPSTEARLRCNRNTGRCDHDTPDTLPTTGTVCGADTDCAAGDECYRSAALGVGICTRFACDAPTRPCPLDERCVEVGASTSCRVDCNVTADCPVGTACDTNSFSCWTTCANDSHCGASEWCTTTTGRSCDAPPCFCRDRPASRDAGSIDAGL